MTTEETQLVTLPPMPKELVKRMLEALQREHRVHPRDRKVLMAALALVEALRNS